MNRVITHPASLLGALLFLLALVPASQAGYTSATPPTSGPTIPGDKAALDRKTGIAFAPENAPECVKRAIWATNFLRTKPYVWGGGHESFYVDGYDCSGSVSFLLHHAGLITRPVVSKEFTSYGSGGKGRWITVYAKDGHVFAVVAGLRLDTSGLGGENGPRWRLACSPGSRVYRPSSGRAVIPTLAFGWREPPGPAKFSSAE